MDLSLDSNDRPKERRPAARPLRKLLLAPLAALLGGCTGVPAGLKPVESFDASRYTGTWYEIMRLDHSFERGLTNVTATYRLQDDGSLSVLNRGLKRETCSWSEAEGTATFQGDSSVASLSVTFFWPFAGGYHVIALDERDYSYALVAGPSRDYLWILARRPDLAPETMDRLVDQARDQGFPVDDLILVDHSDPDCTPAA